jgi:hypothetical protein
MHSTESTTDGTTTLQHTGHLTNINDIPPNKSVFSCNSDGFSSSLMMADYCRNMEEPVYRKKQWYKSVHIGHF